VRAVLRIPYNLYVIFSTGCGGVFSPLRPIRPSRLTGMAAKSARLGEAVKGRHEESIAGQRERAGQLPRATTSLARLLIKQGERDAVREMLATIYTSSPRASSPPPSRKPERCSTDSVLNSDRTRSPARMPCAAYPPASLRDFLSRALRPTVPATVKQ
jgi:hypothetical protein